MLTYLGPKALGKKTSAAAHTPFPSWAGGDFEKDLSEALKRKELPYSAWGLPGYGL